MKTFANWMLLIFMFMYWALRVAVTYTYALGKEFIATPIDYTTEIVILFVTLICMILVAKRQIVGGFIYVVVYFAYFGVSLFKQIMPALKTGELNISAGMDAFLSAIALILSLLVFIDLLGDKTKRPDDKKTEWFFKNKDYDRQIDERADKNNYKLY